MRDFLGLMNLSASSEEYGLNPRAMYNLLGMLLRTFPRLPLTTARAIGWAALLAVITLFVILWWSKGRQISLELAGLAVVLVAFTAPHLHIHSVAFLLLPALNVCLRLAHHSPRLGLAFLPILSLAMLLASFFPPPALYVLTYATMLGLAAAQIPKTPFPRLLLCRAH